MEGLGAQIIEDFWGLELSAGKQTFELKVDEEDIDNLDVEKTLELRQACLGATAKNEERNIVQLTAENEEGETVTHTILSMRVGGTEQCSLFLTVHPPLKIELISGEGPVHIVGSSIETLKPLLDDDTSSSDENEEISSLETLAIQKSMKRRATSPQPAKPAKQMKLASDTSMETLFRAKVEEEDSEEESDDDDFDEDDFEEDDDSEEEVKPPPTKKSQTNGKPKTKTVELKAKVSRTPQPIKPKVQSKKGIQSAPTTPKQGVEKRGPNKDLDDVKKRLLKQLPNVPKRLEKFNNFVANSFNIKDVAVKKGLWEFVQKNRPEK